MKKKIKINIIFLILFLILFFVLSSFYFKNINSSNKNILSEQDFINNLETTKEKIIKNNSSKIFKIVSKKYLKIYKNYDYFQVVDEKIKIKNEIANAFFVGSGILLTNKHILKDENIEYIGINEEKKEFQLKKIWISKTDDLAIFKIINYKKQNDEKFSFIKKNINKMDFIYSLNYEKKIVFGNILTKNITENKINIYLGDFDLKNIIKTDFETKNGDSGSPVFNLKGEIIGINSFIKNGKTYFIFLNNQKIKSILDEI